MGGLLSPVEEAAFWANLADAESFFGISRLFDELAIPYAVVSVPVLNRGVRDTENGVSVDFELAGHYPNGGKPKPVRFPDPAAAAPSRTEITTLHAHVTFD
jgi:hypothetical protein